MKLHCHTLHEPVAIQRHVCKPDESPTIKLEYAVTSSDNLFSLFTTMLRSLLESNWYFMCNLPYREGLEVTDDVSIVEYLKHPVYITEGSYTNIKVVKLPPLYSLLDA